MKKDATKVGRPGKLGDERDRRRQWRLQKKPEPCYFEMRRASGKIGRASSGILLHHVHGRHFWNHGKLVNYRRAMVVAQHGPRPKNPRVYRKLTLVFAANGVLVGRAFFRPRQIHNFLSLCARSPVNQRKKKQSTFRTLIIL